LLVLLFDLEDGSDMFLRNIGWHLTDMHCFISQTAGLFTTVAVEMSNPLAIVWSPGTRSALALFCFETLKPPEFCPHNLFIYGFYMISRINSIFFMHIVNRLVFVGDAPVMQRMQF
jgi:hypothetical protein